MKKVSTFIDEAIPAPRKVQTTYRARSRRALLCGIALPLLLCLCGSAQAATVDLLAGPYTNCPGSGCAKGDYKWGSDATISAGSWVLSTTSGNFTSGDVGKRGVSLDWYGGNSTSGCWSGYACYKGVSCQFTVSSVQTSSQITVSPVAGCGSSGIGFNASGNAYWAVYSDDSTALQNAATAASGGSLNVPASYSGGIYKGVNIPANTTVSCQAGGTFYDPKLNAAQTVLMTPGSGVTITGCSFVGTEPTFGAYYDVTREYNLMISIWSGANDVTISNNTFRGVWGTYVVGSSGGSNATITNNTFQNCGYYGVQLNQTGGANPGTYVSNNTFIDCSYGSEDSSGVKGSPNEYQYIQYNMVYPTAQRGVGYNRSQTSLGLWSAGSVWLDCGTSASGGTPNSQEYLGVTCSNNHVYGANSVLTPCPSGGCPYTKSYGETMLNNICDNGCNGTAMSNTSSPPAITSSTSASGTVGATFSYQITATNSPTSFGASGLPAGLVLSATTGLISGTPANAGVSNITISASNSAGTGQATVVLTIGAGASSSIALKQSNAVQGSAVGSVSVAFPNANTGGNLIVAFVRMSTTTQAVSVTDTAGNTYADAIAQAQTTDGHQVHIFYAKNIHGGANTVKATFSATNNHPWLAIYEYSGLNSISPLDRVAAAQGGSTNVSTGLSGTIQNSNEVVFVGAGFNTLSFAGTVSAGGGYSMLQQNTNTSRAANESAVVSSTGSYAGTFSLSTTANWSAVLATFQP